METKNVLIIGGGLGGLFTGAILAKEGMNVTIIEKNATIGGGLQSFKRFGEVFDTGMHVIGGMQSDGNIRRICEYLGIAGQVELKDVDPFCSDRLYFAEDKQYYDIAKGRTAFVEMLSRSFPEEKEHLNAYVDAIFEIVDRIDLFNLRPSENFVQPLSPSMVISADSFIAGFTKNEKLQSVLAYMNPLYGGRGNQTPAYIHALINVLYIKGTSRFVGGSYKFAELLQSVICENGGRVITNCCAEKVHVKDKCVCSIETNRGQVFEADYYISDIHPCSLLNIMDENAFPKAYKNRLNEIPNSYSAFSLYIKFKKNSFPYINHSEYYMGAYGDIWKFGHVDKEWPLGFLFMTPPESSGHEEYATKALVTAPMSFELVRKWENTKVGNRGEDYVMWKTEQTHKLLLKLEELHPGISECIEAINASSPLTIRDYYNVKEGALSGYSKDCHNLALSQLPVVTKVRNLLLTGQNNNLHGFCGVPLTAINTSEAILGHNCVLNKINGMS